MSHISQRRDLGDEKVIRSFAEQVGTIDDLGMLTLLTYETSTVSDRAPGMVEGCAALGALHQGSSGFLA
jgi:hypothetical protein